MTEVSKPFIKYYELEGKFYTYNSSNNEHQEIKAYEYNAYITMNQRVFENLLTAK